MLFADGSPDGGAIIAASGIGATVAIIIRELIPFVKSILTTKSELDRRGKADDRKDRREDTAEERRRREETREALREYIERLEHALDNTNKDLREVREKAEEDRQDWMRAHQECRDRESALKVEMTRGLARAEAKIEVLQETLRHNKIDFRPYDPDPSGSGPHPTLPPEEKKS